MNHGRLSAAALWASSRCHLSFLATADDISVAPSDDVRDRRFQSGWEGAWSWHFNSSQIGLWQRRRFSRDKRAEGSSSGQSRRAQSPAPQRVSKLLEASISQDHHHHLYQQITYILWTTSRGHRWGLTLPEVTTPCPTSHHRGSEEFKKVRSCMKKKEKKLTERTTRDGNPSCPIPRNWNA